MEKPKRCPKCQSEEVYTNEGNEKTGKRSRIPVIPFSDILVRVNVCCACGYLEEYVVERNPGQLDEIRRNWKRATC